MTQQMEIRLELNKMEVRLSEILGKRIFISILDKIESSTPNAVASVIASVFHISVAEIFGTSRKKMIVEARFLTIWYLYTHYGFNKSQIAEFLDKHHTTIIYALRVVEGYIQTKDEITINAIEIINQKFYNN